MDKPHDHCCGHDHSREHLYGEVNEVPAVFSYETSFDFNKETTGNELCTNLVDWINIIKLWTSQNKYFIGHIKIFAEDAENFNLWLSTTGNRVNINGSSEWETDILKNCTINITAIVFGPTEDSLREIALEKFKRHNF